jgi:hypothetical protein
LPRNPAKQIPVFHEKLTASLFAVVATTGSAYVERHLEACKFLDQQF